MKFLTLADWTGMVETELFAQTYKSYGLATVRYPNGGNSVAAYYDPPAGDMIINAVEIDHSKFAT
jgi:hypothetical protein